MFSAQSFLLQHKEAIDHVVKQAIADIEPQLQADGRFLYELDFAELNNNMIFMCREAASSLIANKLRTSGWAVELSVSGQCYEFIISLSQDSIRSFGQSELL